MMNRSPDIIFMAEYIKNALYFATVRHGKTLKDTVDTHYFSIDNELVYENYYSDFGPLNLGCVYRYCKLLNDKINHLLHNQTSYIVHYTSIEPRKKANAAFLLGCYGVLYLSLTPRDALRPLQAQGQSYRPFQDATQGDSCYTISLLDCLQAIKKARELGFFNFQDFDYDEYQKLDKIQGGDLNWIVPGKFLAFIGPVDCSLSLYHPPEMYIHYFLENNVKIVIRLNKRLYNGNVFTNAGIMHYDLFFADGSCPTRHILFKFLQISEQATCSIAVHCKAGLGRTGSLIGSYLIKHYRMTSHEAIGWMRICRPGSVIGHQQGWLEELEPWLIKQGNTYRRQTGQDPDKFPFHEFGVYSVEEKNRRERPLVIHKPPSVPPPPTNAITHSLVAPLRPQNSRMKEDKSSNAEEEEETEIYLTSCDLTKTPTGPAKQLKGCILKNSTDENHESDLFSENIEPSSWRKYLCCQPCFGTLYDAINKAAEKEHDWRKKCKGVNSNQKLLMRRDNYEASSPKTLQSGAGDPKAGRPSSSSPNRQRPSSQESGRTSPPDVMMQIRGTQVSLIRNVADAKSSLMQSSTSRDRGREKSLASTVTVTPHRGSHLGPCPVNPNIPRTSATSKIPPTQPANRRRLGRSPSPAARLLQEPSRATNTASQMEKVMTRENTTKTTFKTVDKNTLKDVFTRLKNPVSHDGSLVAASLGSRRMTSLKNYTSSVRSDERPTATQGDMLNSIKFERRFRATLNLEKTGLSENNCAPSRKASTIKNVNSRTSKGTIVDGSPSQSFAACGTQVTTVPTRAPREKSPNPRNVFGPSRPMSPKGRRNTLAFY